MKLRYITELDGVRGVAALMVILFHFFHGLFKSSGFVYDKLHKVSIFGQSGVILFFVLSGFLITRILLDTKEDESYFKKFYIRRSLRIFPLYYFALALYFFVLPFLLKGIPDCHGQGEWYFWVYLQNVARTFEWPSCGPSHFWTLAVEEHFYLFWPLIVYLFNFEKLTKTIVIILIVTIIVRVVMLENRLGIFYFTFSQMDSLAIGGLLAIWERKGTLASKTIYFKIALPVLAFLLIAIWYMYSGEGNMFIQVIKPLVLSGFYVSVIGYIINTNGWVQNVFKNKILLFTGKISYGLYVYHPFVFLFIYEYLNSKFIIVNFITCVGMTYMVSLLSYYLFEKRFINMKSLFSY
ncbi:MAG: acyltransferase family protein [Cytophaga sp.]|uniref:acyltransferase family protein n=1 Tax=Cytophaga sp. TaxID=29535 RepID=UPI003F7E290A